MKTKLVLVMAFLAFQFSLASSTSDTVPIAPNIGPLNLCDLDSDGIECFDLTIQNSAILAAQTGNASDYQVSYYETFTDASTGSLPIMGIYCNIRRNIQQVYYRVEEISTGDFAAGVFELIVNPVPFALQPNYPEYVLCDVNAPAGHEAFDLNSRVSSILMGQTGKSVTFYPSLAQAQSGENPISSSLYTNTVIYRQTLGIRITNDITGCYSVSTMDIKVESLPQLIAPTNPSTICDSDQDGFSTFELDSLIPGLDPSGNYEISFHETLMDAQTGFNSVDSFYTNVVPFSQTIYARGYNPISGCFAVLSILLRVNPSPIAASVPSIAVCDTDSNPQDGTTLINLTTQATNVIAQQPLPASNYLMTYHSNQSDAEAGLNAIIPLSNYLASNGEIIWYRIELNTTHCFTVGSFHLIIDTPLVLITPTPLNVCDNDMVPNNQYTTFDLTVKDYEITQGSNQIVTYYPSFALAQTGTNPISNPTAYTNIAPSVQTLGVRVTSPGGCVSITILDIRVMPIPTPNTNPPALAPQCDVNNTGDMMEVFDLIVNVPYIANGDTNLTFLFFRNITDALANYNEIFSPNAILVGGNAWIKVQNNRVDYVGNRCYVLVEQPLTVNPLPNTELVSDNTLDTVFVDANNNVIQALTLNTQLTGNYSFQWEVDGNAIPNATSSSYTIGTATPTGTSRVFMVSVTDLETGCSSTDSITVLQSGGVPSPRGQIFQSFNPGDTLATLDANGTGILWYASAADKNSSITLSTPLPLNTLLVDGATYYASQTIGGVESMARLPVTVHLVLGIPDRETMVLHFGPNPVKNSLVLQSDKVLKSIEVYTMLGQKVLSQNCNGMNLTIDVSLLSAGNYVLKAQSDTGQKTIRLIKE